MELGFTTMNTPEDVRADVLGRALEERGLHIALHRRALAHPGASPDAVPGRWRDARPVPADDGSVRQSDDGGNGDRAPADRPRRLPRARAPRARPGQGGRHPRRWCRAAASCSASVSAGTRRSWRTTGPTSRGASATEQPRSASRRCAVLDRRRGRVPRRVLRLRPGVVVPEARAAAAPADPARDGRSGRHAARRSVGRRVDADGHRPRRRRQEVGRFREAAAAAGREIPISIVTFGDPAPGDPAPVPRARHRAGRHRLGPDGLGRSSDDDAVHRSLRPTGAGAGVIR